MTKKKYQNTQSQVQKSGNMEPFTESLETIAGLGNVEVEISVEWGRVMVPLDQVRRLAAGSRLIADQLADEPVDIRVNGKLFGRGRIVMIDEQYGVQLTEITS